MRPIQRLLTQISQAERAGNKWKAKELDKQLAKLQKPNR